MSQNLKLTAAEAATILKANHSNFDYRSKKILQKVVDKRTLSDNVSFLVVQDEVKELLARKAETEELITSVTDQTETILMEAASTAASLHYMTRRVHEKEALVRALRMKVGWLAFRPTCVRLRVHPAHPAPSLTLCRSRASFLTQRRSSAVRRA